MTPTPTLRNVSIECYNKISMGLSGLATETIRTQSLFWERTAQTAEHFFQRHACTFVLIGTSCTSACFTPKAFFAGTVITFISCHTLHYLPFNRLERIVTARDACFSTLGAALSFYVAYRYDTLNWSVRLLSLVGAGPAGYCAYKCSKNLRFARIQTQLVPLYE